MSGISVLQLWDMRVKGCIHTFAEDYQVTSVAFADASDKVYTGGIDNTVRVWDLRKSEVFMKLEVRALWAKCISMASKL